MIGNNSNIGKPAFISLAKQEEKPVEPAPAVGVGESAKVRTTADKVMKSAKKAADTSGLQNTAKPAEQMVLRSIKYSEENYRKMSLVKKQKGPDYTWQVNKALEHWFNTVHTDIL